MIRLIRFFLLVIFLLSLVNGYSQRIANVSASYIYYAPETMSVEEAKRTALDRARIQAIADEFGTIVSQSTSSLVTNNNGISDTHFFSLGGSDVRGEWIDTTGEPEYEIVYADHFLLVKCTVKGKAREIVGDKIDVDVKTLRNGTDTRYESVDFKHGDDLFLYFLSPVDGYISVYLLDEKDQKVYCMLPYRDEAVASVGVEAGKEVIFFSRDKAEKTYKNIVDEYQLSCEDDKEFNTLFVLFSTNPIGKRNGFNNSSVDKPDNIGLMDFRNWLSKIRVKDSSLQIQELNISISK